MKALARYLLAAALACGALQASAQRMPVAIVNHPNIAVALHADGRPATEEDVRKAILTAAQATGRKWTVAEPEPGHMVATYHVRTHTVVTDIDYTALQFSVFYKDSVNMKFGPGPDGKGVIHPFYNRWVDEFIQQIQLELGKAS